MACSIGIYVNIIDEKIFVLKIINDIMFWKVQLLMYYKNI